MSDSRVDPAGFMQIGVRGLYSSGPEWQARVIWPERYKTAEPKLPIPAWDLKR